MSTLLSCYLSCDDQDTFPIFFSRRLQEYDPLFYAAQVEAQVMGEFTAITAVCEICFDNFRIDAIWNKCNSYETNDSRRGVCGECMRSYLSSKIHDGEVSGDGEIQCPCSDFHCTTKLPEGDIRTYLGDCPDLLKKYKQFTLNAAIDKDPNRVWCPSAGCGAIVRVPSGKSKAHCAKCGLHFCTKCMQSHSVLLTCGLASDSHFRRWKGTTPQGCKRCPRCHIYIEKNMGCSHMLCSKCRHEFCWGCMWPYTSKCSAPVGVCELSQLMESKVWGKSTPSRVITKCVGIPIMAGVSGAALGIAGGLCITAAGATVGIGLATSPVLASIYLYHNPPEYIRKYLPAPNYTDLDNASMLQRGVRLNAPWQHDDPTYAQCISDSSNDRFIGFNGRWQNSIFVAYINPGMVEGFYAPVSYVVYIVPQGASRVDVEALSLHEYEMLEVSLPSQAQPQKTLLDESILVELGQQLSQEVRSRRTFVYTSS